MNFDSIAFRETALLPVGYQLKRRLKAHIISFSSPLFLEVCMSGLFEVSFTYKIENYLVITLRKGFRNNKKRLV